VRKLATLICLILIATSCSNDSDSEEVSALKEKVSILEKKLDNTVNESKYDSVWNSDYQETWMEVCETILEYEEENTHSIMDEMLKVTADPYLDQKDMEDYALPAKDDEQVTQTFCGT